MHLLEQHCEFWKHPLPFGWQSAHLPLSHFIEQHWPLSLQNSPLSVQPLPWQEPKKQSCEQHWLSF